MDLEGREQTFFWHYIIYVPVLCTYDILCHPYHSLGNRNVIPILHLGNQQQNSEGLSDLPIVTKTVSEKGCNHSPGRLQNPIFLPQKHCYLSRQEAKSGGSDPCYRGRVIEISCMLHRGGMERRAAGGTCHLCARSVRRHPAS